MPPRSSTPAPDLGPLLPHDPETWTNSRVRSYVVQAQPTNARRDENLAVQPVLTPTMREVQCGRDEPCPGTSDAAIRGVRLDRDDALHAINTHYNFANWSLARFTDASHVMSATDLVFEVDAHVKVPALPSFLGFYTPIVATAAHVARRLYDHLVGPLGVHPLYITTCVTRMGSRVTVDWRAFGPRRLHELLAVVRFIEAQVFRPGELDELGVRLTRAMQRPARLLASMASTLLDEPIEPIEYPATVKVDGSIYGASERATNDRDRGHEFKGPLIRPPGALHPSSSSQALWFRTTPVPARLMRATNAKWLTRVSRGHRREVEEFEDPKLFRIPWPETRRPRGDALIEGDAHRPRLPVARKLMEMLDAWQALAIPADDRRRIERQARNARATRSTSSSTPAITPEVVNAVVDGLNPKKVRRKSDKINLTCPYCGEHKAVVFVESGAFKCPRDKCVGSRSLAQLAADHGLAALVPWRAPSSVLLQRQRVADLPRKEGLTWNDLGDHRRVVVPDVAAARAWLKQELREALLDDDARVVVVAAATGVGKTTTTVEVVRELGIVTRAAFPRDENKEAFITSMGGPVEAGGTVRNIVGRRPENCRNDAVELLRKRRLPMYLACGSHCPHYNDCDYLRQFEGNEGVSLAVHHAHLPLLKMRRFENESELLLIDENPLLAAFDVVSLDLKELDLFRTSIDVRSESFEGIEGLTDDDLALGADEITLRNVGATPRTEALITWLEGALTKDAMSHGRFGGDVAADLPLARHWCSDAEFVSIVGAIDEIDLEAQDEAALEVAEDYFRVQQLGTEISRLLRRAAEIEAAPSEAEPWPLGFEPAADLREQARVMQLTHKYRLGKLRNPPQGIFRDLVAALRHLISIHNGGTNRPSLLHAVAGDNAWSLRLTQRRQIFHGKTVVLSATMSPDQFALAYGATSSVRVLEPVVQRRERRVLVADHQFGTSRLTGDTPEEAKLRSNLFETVKALMERERARTGLPVAVIGRSSVINMWNEFLLGRRLPERLKMPFTTDRAERAAELRALTEPLGYLAGYAGGVSGDNTFCVEEAGLRRFVRSLILLGNVLPRLDTIEKEFRGVFAEHRFLQPVESEFGPLLTTYDHAPDWTIVSRPVPIEGQAQGEGDAMTVLTAMNVVGYADHFANEVLRNSYEDEVVQIIGRMRGLIPDPVDPGIEPTAWLFAHVAIPGMTMDEVLALDDVRERVGLARLSKHRGRRLDQTPTAIATCIKKEGRKKAMRLLVKALLKSGYTHYKVTGARTTPGDRPDRRATRGRCRDIDGSTSSSGRLLPGGRAG